MCLRLNLLFLQAWSCLMYLHIARCRTNLWGSWYHSGLVANVVVAGEYLGEAGSMRYMESGTHKAHSFGAIHQYPASEFGVTPFKSCIFSFRITSPNNRIVCIIE